MTILLLLLMFNKNARKQIDVGSFIIAAILDIVIIIGIVEIINPTHRSIGGILG